MKYNIKNDLKKIDIKTKFLSGVLFCSLASLASGQVAIGKTEVAGSSALLDFPIEDYELGVGDGNGKGIILSAVDKEPVFAITPGVSSPNNGTFVFDRTSKTVKMFENNKWVDLTDTGDSSQADANANVSDETPSNQGVIIGASTSEAIGVLVLESPDKALILPRVWGAHGFVKSPYPGTMTYETGDYLYPSANDVFGRIAIFDGINWSYWGIPRDVLEQVSDMERPAGTKVSTVSAEKK